MLLDTCESGNSSTSRMLDSTVKKGITKRKRTKEKPDFHLIWLIMIKCLLNQGKNSPFCFQISVNPEKNVENGRFELVSLTMPIPWDGIFACTTCHFKGFLFTRSCWLMITLMGLCLSDGVHSDMVTMTDPLDLESSVWARFDLAETGPGPFRTNTIWETKSGVTQMQRVMQYCDDEDLNYSSKKKDLNLDQSSETARK